MKILHIASFKGNIGDIVNHQGFYNLTGLKNEAINQIEIRKFYNNSRELRWDKSMLNRINSHDCLILGGGGYFDVYWNASDFGTTLNMTEDFIDGIKIPVIINAMGVHIDYTASEAILKFGSFFRKISSKDNWLVTIRNDGSMSRLKKIVKDIPKSVTTVPDNGFAFDEIPYEGINSGLVGLSITNDLFTKKYNGLVDTEKFNEEIADFCKYILHQGKQLIFFMHTPQDIKVLYNIFEKIGSEAFREKIKIAPYDTYSVENANVINRLYSKCKYVIAMRFHGNVISLKNRTPVIGLAGHEQVEGLYSEISLRQQCIVVKDGFKDILFDTAEKMDSNALCFSNIQNDMMTEINLQQVKYREMIHSFIDTHF